MCMMFQSGCQNMQCYQGMNIFVNTSTEHPNDNLVDSASASENLPR